MLTGIIGTIESTVFRFYDRVNTIRIGSRNSDADLAQNSVGKAIAFEMLPGNAIVFGAIDSAARSAA